MNKKISFKIQIVLSIVLLIVGIITLFKHELFPILEIIIGCDLMCLAYNNQQLFKRKELTTTYFVFGILVLIIGILSLFGVI